MNKQAQIDFAKTLWVKAMEMLRIPYEVEAEEISQADAPDEKLNAYIVSTANACGCIIFDFSKNDVGYLLLNDKLFGYFREEGLGQGELENAKYWIVFSALGGFLNAFINAEKVNHSGPNKI